MKAFDHDSAQMEVLDFATDKRQIWEQNHHLYSVIFEITPKCNFNCVHCYLHDRHDFLSLPYERIVEILDILYEKEVLFLTLTGGEIFSRRDFLDIYLYAKKKGFIVELYTNGALLTQEILDAFRQYPPLLVDISLYGSCEETYHKVTGVAGAFDKVMANIQALLDADIRVSLKTPVLNLYEQELPAMRAIAQTFGVAFRNGLEIFTSVDNDSTVQQYGISTASAIRYEIEEFLENPRTFGADFELETVKLLEQRPLFRCKLGRGSCVIDYTGNICPCMSFRHAGKPLTRESFDALWGSFAVYPKMKAKADYKCLRCKAYDFCDICPAMMEFVHGDMEYVDSHFCKSAHARYAYYIQKKSVEEVLSSLE